MSFLPTVTFNEGNLKASVERKSDYETKQKRLGKVITGVIHYQNIDLYKHAVRQDRSYDHAILLYKDLAELHHKTEELQGES